MLFTTVIIAAFAAAPALAFTNGTIVPAYICNPNNDGLPKNFGQVLQLTREQTTKVGFNTNKGQDVPAPALAAQGNSKIGNSAYILASLHDSPNSVTPINQGIKVTTANGGPIVAGKANLLTLSSNANGVALKGALLYAQDTAGVRQGSFTDQNKAGPFIPFAGCGKNPQGQVSGVIQQTGISATGTYKTLVYNAPACVNSGNLTIAGLSVTGNGFGVWKYNFAVTGSTCSTGATTATPPKAPKTTGTAGKQAAGKPASGKSAAGKSAAGKQATPSPCAKGKTAGKPKRGVEFEA